MYSNLKGRTTGGTILSWLFEHSSKTRVVEVSETGALWFRRLSLFDILYKKQTVSAGRVHKHSMHRAAETPVCQ